jgi:hypothetical protein
MSLPNMRRLGKASRHGLSAHGTIYVGTLPINRTRDADSSAYPSAGFSTAIPTGGRVASLECATGNELPHAVAVDSGADYFAWSCRSAACILRSTVRMVSSSSTEMSAVAMS